jgi:hypothetical protein
MFAAGNPEQNHPPSPPRRVMLRVSGFLVSLFFVLGFFVLCSWFLWSWLFVLGFCVVPCPKEIRLAGIGLMRQPMAFGPLT